MKILAWTSTIDMKFRMGPTIAWWQLLKALHELGHEVIMTPYLGQLIETPWWRAYPNPCRLESEMYNWYLDKKDMRSVGFAGNDSHSHSIFSKISYWFIDYHIRPAWEKHFIRICEREKPDALLVLSVPLNHIMGIPAKIRQTFMMPVIYYDTDLPMSLPDFADQSAFKFSMYEKVDISEYDLFLSCSKGILPRLVEMGARRANHLYFAADPNLFVPINIEKDVDIFYYGHRSAGKEVRMDYMLKEPSLIMTENSFYVGGKEFNIDDIGKARVAGTMPLNVWRNWCNRSRINLNITKDTDARIYGSSSARPFELAAMGCCIVSDAYEGMNEWFEEGNELCIAKDVEQAISLYTDLLSDGIARERMGKAARERVLAEHTYRHRGSHLVDLITSL